MTSSLVGSEMCIRDRDEPKKSASLLFNELLEPVPVWPALAWFLEPTVRDCLLYTSDAADDM
eukprot:5068385-Prorocentrum_lima.AAC.1